ncbi:ATP-binding protein [Nocardia wallacei]|uniref:ATP-binding protein n=1 Tax=Nocardia wallacei TaxID=480035 RepID=UPI002454381A|nr:LuxR C-terminal-related transcriptional regulator [Nocardia wallacei]
MRPNSESPGDPGQRSDRTPADDFVGRAHELDTIVTLLMRGTRLVTLIGPGGIGKTRLAAKAAQRLAKASRTPVHTVRLARLAPDSDAAAVEEEIARSVVTTDYSGRSMWEALTTTLTRIDGRNRTVRVVLVLDNCEHVLAGAGVLIARMLEAIPGLCIVATSREAIGWVDEQQFPVPPLPPHQALQLFRQRAELAGRPFGGADDTAMADQICRQMDYHPLFIHLAAGRLARRPMRMILAEICGGDRRLDWPAGPVFGGEERHRSINDVIGWSYDLCSEKERALFDRLSVFAGGYDTDPGAADDPVLPVGADLDAIRHICADSDGMPTDGRMRILDNEIEGLLERLADQSLVSRQLTATTVYYSLSGNLRVYAQQQLNRRTSGEPDAAARLAERHCDYYRDRIREAAANCFGAAAEGLVDWANAAWHNIVLATERSLVPGGNALRGLEICVGLLELRLAFVKGSFREMRLRTERALDTTRTLSPPPHELRVTAMALLVWIMLSQGEIGDAERMLDRCARTCLPDAVDTWRATPDQVPGLPAVVDFAWGVELFVARRDPVAIVVLQRAQRKFDRAGNTASAIPSQQLAALAAALLGTATQARDLAWQYLERTTAAGVPWTRSWAQLTWSIALTRLGDPGAALAVQRTVLADLEPVRERWASLWAVEFRAWTLAQIITDPANRAADPRPTSAVATEIALLAGGTRRLRATLGIEIRRLGPFADLVEEAVQAAENVLGPEVFAATEARGAQLRPERNEVQQLASGTPLAGKRMTPVANTDAGGSAWATLTSAEQDVAALAAAGWTNSAIAARRGKSRRTVDAQVAAVLRKLRITSRADIADFIPGLPAPGARTTRKTR